MERVDESGRVIGFSIMQVSRQGLPVPPGNPNASVVIKDDQKAVA